MEKRRNMVRNLYIIAKGEFEITIKVHEDNLINEEDKDPKELIGFLRPGNSKLSTSTAPPVKQTDMKTRIRKIIVVGPGNLLGLEDIAGISPHTYGARCVSQTGIILKMDVEKFHPVIRHIPNGFTEISKINKIKFKSFFDKLTLLEEQDKHILGRQKQQLVDNKRNSAGKNTGNFTNMEFFKATYFEMKLDRKKMMRIFEAKD